MSRCEPISRWLEGVVSITTLLSDSIAQFDGSQRWAMCHLNEEEKNLLVGVERCWAGLVSIFDHFSLIWLCIAASKLIFPLLCLFVRLKLNNICDPLTCTCLYVDAHSRLFYLLFLFQKAISLNWICALSFPLLNKNAMENQQSWADSSSRMHVTQLYKRSRRYRNTFNKATK